MSGIVNGAGIENGSLNSKADEFLGLPLLGKIRDFYIRNPDARGKVREAYGSPFSNLVSTPEEAARILRCVPERAAYELAQIRFSFLGFLGDFTIRPCQVFAYATERLLRLPSIRRNAIETRFWEYSTCT